MESVRIATPADAGRCAQLLEVARQEVLATRGGRLLLDAGHGALAGGEGISGPSGEGLAAWVAQHLESPETESGRLLVGEFDGVVVGVAAGVIVAPTAPAEGPVGPVGHVACCYVERPARAVGVGTALIDALREWFTDRGCVAMEALALPGDRDTKQLYETSGLKARLLVMHRPLP